MTRLFQLATLTLMIASLTACSMTVKSSTGKKVEEPFRIYGDQSLPILTNSDQNDATDITSTEVSPDGPTVDDVLSKDKSNDNPPPTTNDNPSKVVQSSKTNAKSVNALKLPHVTLNMKERYIDLPGFICFRDGLTETAVTVRAGKPHESPIAMNARPQHVHMALMMLGLKPGAPGHWLFDKKTKQSTPVDPKGSLVKVSVMFKDKEGKAHRVGISQFIKDKLTNKTMPHDYFVFSGSAIRTLNDGRVMYAADSSGNAISLVSFGDDMLSWPRAASHTNSEIFLVAATQNIPALDTKVTVRLEPAPAEVTVEKLNQQMNVWYAEQAKAHKKIIEELENEGK